MCSHWAVACIVARSKNVKYLVANFDNVKLVIRQPLTISTVVYVISLITNP